MVKEYLLNKSAFQVAPQYKPEESTPDEDAPDCVLGESWAGDDNPHTADVIVSLRGGMAFIDVLTPGIMVEERDYDTPLLNPDDDPQEEGYEQDGNDEYFLATFHECAEECSQDSGLSEY